jgi:hypothetical protein
MISFVDNTSIARGGEGELQQDDEALIPNISKCKREAREAGARGGFEEIMHI